MNIAQADIVFLRYTYTWYLLPNTAEMCCQNWLYRTCGTSLPRSATTLRRNSSSVTGKTTMCICLSIIRPKYPSLSWSTVSRVYPVAVCEAFALKLRVGIAKVSFGRRLILPLHVVVRRSILSANMSKRSEPTKNRASAVAPYIPALKDEVLRRVPIIDPKQIFQTIWVKRIALHIKEQITIIRHWHTGKAFARRERNDLAFIFTRGGFVMLQDGL